MLKHIGEHAYLVKKNSMNNVACSLKMYVLQSRDLRPSTLTLSLRHSRVGKHCCNTLQRSLFSRDLRLFFGYYKDNNIKCYYPYGHKVKSYGNYLADYVTMPESIKILGIRAHVSLCSYTHRFGCLDHA